MGSELRLEEMGISLTNRRRRVTAGLSQVKMSSYHRGAQNNKKQKASTFCSKFTGSDSQLKTQENKREHPPSSTRMYRSNTRLTDLERAAYRDFDCDNGCDCTHYHSHKKYEEQLEIISSTIKAQCPQGSDGFHTKLISCAVSWE